MTTPIGIKVTMDGAAPAATGLDKVTASTERLGNAAKTHTSTVDDLNKAFGALGLTLGAAQVLGAVKQWTLDADKLADSLTTLGGRSVEFASTLTSGAVTQMEAATARSRLLTAGLDLTNEQFEALTVAAAAFAQGEGKEATEVLSQLTQGLVTGRTRGLEPLIGSFAEGASKADVQAEAIRRLTAASADNQAQLAANSGSLDALGWGWDKVKEKLGATYSAMLDAPFSTILPAIKDVRDALSGDMGLADAALDVTRRFAELNSVVPGAGGALAGFIADALGASHAADAAADSAARLANRLARLRGGPGRGFNMAGDVAEQVEGGGLDGIDAYSAQRRGRDAAVTRALGDPTTVGTGERLIDTSYGAGTAARRRGGGGGGRRGALADTDLMTDAPRRREEAAREYSGQDSLFGIDEGAWSRGQPRGQESTWDDAPRATSGTRSARDGMTNGIDRQISTYERLETRGKSVLDSLNKAWESHFAAFAKGEESFGMAMKGMASAALESIATQSLQEAGFQVAKGIGSLAAMDYPGAALHFASAAAFGLIAGGAYAGSAAIAPGSSSRSSAGGDSFRTPTSSTSLGQRSANDGAGVTVVFNLAPGAIVGGGDARATQDWLRSQIDEGTTRANRIRRLAA